MNDRQALYSENDSEPQMGIKPTTWWWPVRFFTSIDQPMLYHHSYVWFTDDQSSYNRGEYILSWLQCYQQWAKFLQEQPDLVLSQI